MSTCADKCKSTHDADAGAPYGYYRTCVPKQQLQSMTDSRGVSEWVQRNFPADHDGYFGGALDTNAAALQLAGNFEDFDHNQITSGDDDNVCLWFTRKSALQEPDAPFGTRPSPSKAPVISSFEQANVTLDGIMDTFVPGPLQGFEHRGRRAALWLLGS